MIDNTATTSDSTTFPDGTVWSRDGLTVTAHLPGGARSWAFPAARDVTLAWVSVLMH